MQRYLLYRTEKAVTTTNFTEARRHPNLQNVPQIFCRLRQKVIIHRRNQSGPHPSGHSVLRDGETFIQQRNNT